MKKILSFLPMVFAVVSVVSLLVFCFGLSSGVLSVDVAKVFGLASFSSLAGLAITSTID